MKRLSPVLAILCLLCASPAAWGAFSNSLLTLGMDQVWADARFTSITGSGQSVAVLDTGADPFQASISGKVLTGQDYAPGAVPSPIWRDLNGHGTRVSALAVGARRDGIAGGTTYQIGGVAPGASLIPLRVADANGDIDITYAGMLNALNWVKANAATYNISAVNISLATTTTYLNQQQALAGNPTFQTINSALIDLKNMNIMVFAAAGNNGSATELTFPAILNSVVAVGATDTAGNLATTGVFKTNRNGFLDLLAPGETVVVANGDPASTALHTSTGFSSGTSFSSPEAAGASLLVRELFLQRVGRLPTWDEVLAILQSTGPTITEGSNTWHEVNVFSALNYTDALPEPASLLLLGTGLLGVVRARRRAA